jgi:POT family
MLQNSTTMLLQGMRMDATVGDAMIPAAALNFAKMLIVTLLIPVLDRIVFPFMARFGRQPTLLHRLGLYLVDYC